MSELRLLAQDSSHGYTSRFSDAMPFEPEAISADEQKVISLRARTQFAESREEETRRRDNRVWLERLRKAEMRAESAGIDIFRHQALIRRQVLAIEQRIQGGTFLGGTYASA